uniref:Uncharacterized protein n=1 Tax=Rhizophora mucronata TaxID=61149 RepID=A0A2P2NPS7_RHIMU
MVAWFPLIHNFSVFIFVLQYIVLMLYVDTYFWLDISVLQKTFSVFFST